ncbi:MAG: type IX secretion system protein PorQ [Sphingobacteriales bacterium]|nr:MAG: type IX secretion system protein PorQ [Sphingobacteriales bacterium]
MHKHILAAALVLSGLSASAQIGGKRTFSFLEMPVGAKMAAIGGVNVTSPGADMTMTFANPALLNDDMVGRAAFNHAWFLADVRQNVLGYTFDTDKFGPFAVGLHHINYGKMTETDATGAELGEFSASDYAFQVSHAQTTGVFTLGATAKLAVSSIAGQSSMAGLVDLGGSFKHPEHELQVGMVIKNIGYNFKTFDGGETQPMPFDVQLGISHKLEHMPLRFSLTAHRLYQFDIVYLDPNKKTNQLNADNTEEQEKKTFGDKALRHLVVGGEFLLSKNINFRVGYNHLRRRELRMEDQAGGAGFSFGGLIRIKSFEFAFTKAYYHVAGSTTFLAISANVGKKKVEEIPAETITN